MSPWIDALDQALTSEWAYLIFCVVITCIAGIVILAALFAGLAIRYAIRQLRGVFLRPARHPFEESAARQ